MSLFDLTKRPTSLDEMILYKDLRKALNSYVENCEFKSLLFHGDVGVGKTTAAKIIMTACENKNNTNLFEYDCSTIDTAKSMKAVVKSIQTTSLFSRHKIYLFDEFHTISKPLQAHLNIPIENSTSQFILCVNDATKITDPILSRSRPLNFDHAVLNRSATKLEMLPHTNMTIDEYKNEIFRVAKLYALRDDVELTDKDLDECASANIRRLTDMRYFMMSLDAQLREKQSN
jgi:replication-associated recombination protein RarA